VKLVREIVAMMNSGGGTVEIGVTNDGSEVGVEAALAARFDPARVGDLIETFIAPDRTEISVTRRTLENGRHVVSLIVPPSGELETSTSRNSPWAVRWAWCDLKPSPCGPRL
jgi:hypothetical protein